MWSSLEINHYSKINVLFLSVSSLIWHLDWTNWLQNDKDLVIGSSETQFSKMALYGYFNGFVLLTPQLDMRFHALKLSLKRWMRKIKTVWILSLKYFNDNIVCRKPSRHAGYRLTWMHQPKCAVSSNLTLYYMGGGTKMPRLEKFQWNT